MSQLTESPADTACTGTDRYELQFGCYEPKINNRVRRMHAEKTADNRPMTPSQNYKSSRRGFSLAELIVVMGIMVGIWLGALAYMNAASEKFDKAKADAEEDLAPDPEDDNPEDNIAKTMLGEETAAEQAFRAEEAAAARAAAYKQLLQEVLGRMDTSLKNGVLPNLLSNDIVFVSRSGRAFTLSPKKDGRWPKRSVQADLCREAMRGREGWSCEILYAGTQTRITIPESTLSSN